MGALRLPQSKTYCVAGGRREFVFIRLTAPTIISDTLVTGMGGRGGGGREKRGRESERISPGLGVTGTNLLVGNYKCFGRFDFIALCKETAKAKGKKKL